jgi:carbonic anhydrase/acetyltransferase-like protein (isoleucine patch superfamily)
LGYFCTLFTFRVRAAIREHQTNTVFLMPLMHQVGDFYVADTATVTGDIVCGPGVNLWFGVIIRGDLARITLGAAVNLQDGVIVHTDTDAPQDIDEGVVVGHGAILHGKRIGADTLIGMRATLLSGCEIGEECLIAAGTLIPEGRRIPPRSVVMGAPGKVIRAVTDAEVEHTRSINVRYQEMAKKYAAGGVKQLLDL